MCDFQASSLETKQLWVKRLRELIQDRLPFLNPTLCDPLHEVTSLKAPTHKLFQPNRHSRSVLRISSVIVRRLYVILLKKTQRFAFGRTNGRRSPVR